MSDPPLFTVSQLLERLRETRAFGINDHHLGDGAFSGSFPYEFRAAVLNANVRGPLLDLLAKRTVSNADRLWAISFLEDDDVGLQRLQDAPDSYIVFLRRCLRADNPLFIMKMARFQLILKTATDFDPGVEYVEWVRSTEVDTSE